MKTLKDLGPDLVLAAIDEPNEKYLMKLDPHMPIADLIQKSFNAGKTGGFYELKSWIELHPQHSIADILYEIDLRLDKLQGAKGADTETKTNS